jgi:hypothetical protein
MEGGFLRVESAGAHPGFTGRAFWGAHAFPWPELTSIAPFAAVSVPRRK